MPSLKTRGFLKAPLSIMPPFEPDHVSPEPMQIHTTALKVGCCRSCEASASSQEYVFRSAATRKFPQVGWFGDEHVYAATRLLTPLAQGYGALGA